MKDKGTFQFKEDGTSLILNSIPGVFRLCFCRPADDLACNVSSDFKASVGLFTARGPFDPLRRCVIGQACEYQLSGVGLDQSDSLIVTDLRSCSMVTRAGVPNFDNRTSSMSQEFQLTRLNGNYYVNFGNISRNVTGPGLGQRCLKQLASHLEGKR